MVSLLVSLSVCQSVGQSVHHSCFKGFLTHFFVFLNSEKKLGGVNRRFLSVFEKEIVCPSVCLAFFESADARDLGLMTLFYVTYVLFRCVLASQ